ncbi:T-complex protein 1 subunit theta-like [Sycon ciliatum]|uniref:T-complex protein 1 subunit theta-like n=1 Tax=Sycon ciliatum TaxID=27933 RepID=UPI0031F71817
MALHVPKSGFSSMLKDGAKHMSGLNEATFRNISACNELTTVIRSSYGPTGMNKMVVNHLGKVFVSSDAQTIVRELEVQHPAAKMLVMASDMMEQECGDGTNFVLILAGMLLGGAEDLLRMGLSVPEVAEGYEMAAAKVQEILPGLVCSKLESLTDVEQVAKAIKTSVASMQYGYEGFLSKLIGEACVSVLSEKRGFSVDNIRVCKIPGSGVLQSKVIRGMVFKREVEGDVTRVENARIVCFNCAFDFMQTETKGTVLIKTAKELLSFSQGEEDLLEAQIKALVDLGVNVVVSQGKPGDMAMHFANKHGLMVARVMSKFDLRRLCSSINATALPTMTVPTKEELGSCDLVHVTEIGDTSLTVFQQNRQENAIATVVVRGSTSNLMDDMERAIDDGVNTFKTLTRDPRFVPGAGATEVELALQLASYSRTIPGVQQYAIKKFADVLETFPRTLADNAGVKANAAISKLYAAHQEGNKNAGIDIESETAAHVDAFEAGILDLLTNRSWAVKLATNAAATVLRVDQIIMAKKAGGPKPPKQGPMDADD